MYLSLRPFCTILPHPSVRRKKQRDRLKTTNHSERINTHLQAVVVLQQLFSSPFSQKRLYIYVYFLYNR